MAKGMKPLDFEPRQDTTRPAKTPMVIELTKAHLLFMLNNYALGLGADTSSIPTNAEVTVDVPGGGDWSGMPLEITDGRSIYVRWHS